MSSGPTLDLRAFIDARRFSSYQWLILALCFMIVFIDGFDVGSVGFIAPALVQTLHVKRESLGPVLSAALIGLALGALVAGPIADRMGRKAVLVGSVLLFGLCSIASAFAHDIETLTVLRLITGVGLGGAMPNAIALMAEYSPTRRRPMFVTLMFCGYTFGSALGGFIAAALIPHFGWPSVFLVGGLTPLALAALLAALLPESALFLVSKGRSRDKVVAALSRIAPEARAELEAARGFTAPELGLARMPNPVRTILSPPLVLGTLLMWAVFFSGLVVVFLLTSWLPILLKGAGFSLSAAALVSALFQLGGTAGALLVAFGMERIGRHRAIAISYAIGAVLIFALGASAGNLALLSLCVLGAGFFISGGQSTMNALCAEFYPTQVRATGLGWMLGVGRLGAILGAYIGGPLLALGWGFDDIIQILAIPALIAAAGVAIKGMVYAKGGERGALAATAASGVSAEA